jgi:soluble lytic murein transglycosylase-like protein
MDTQEQNVSLLLCGVLVASLSFAPAPAPEPPETPDQEASDPREDTILRNIERYRDFRLDRDLAEKIHDQAAAQGIDPDLAFAVVAAESSFRPGARSPVGALGLAQVMPATARWMRPGIGEQELLDPAVNLKLGFTHLRWLLSRYGDSRLALLAYNRGHGRVDGVLRDGGDPDNGYADRVLGFLE